MRMCRSCAVGRELEPAVGTASKGMEVCYACNQLTVTHETVQRPPRGQLATEGAVYPPYTDEEIARGIDEAEDLPWSAQEQATRFPQEYPRTAFEAHAALGMTVPPQDAPRNAPEPRETASAPSRDTQGTPSTVEPVGINLGCWVLGAFLVGCWFMWSVMVAWKGW